MPVFNEHTLRQNIIDIWGPAGAHIEVFDTLVNRLEISHELLSDVDDLMTNGCITTNNAGAGVTMTRVNSYVKNIAKPGSICVKGK